MVFRGQPLRSLDSKGRLMLPTDFRDQLAASAEGGTFMLTTYDGCLVGYPMPLWLDLEIKFTRLRNPSRAVRDFRRLVLGGAEEQTPDAQGRIRLSQAHLTYAGIERSAVLLGQLDRFEIWEPSRLQTVKEQKFDNVADELASSGFDFAF